MSNIRIINLSDVKFTSPDTLLTKEGETVSASKKIVKTIMSSLGLVGDKFSKDLYDVDENVWAGLLEKKYEGNAFYQENALILNSFEVISVVTKANQEWLYKIEAIVKSLENLPEEVKVSGLRQEDGFSVLVMKDDYGYILDVSIPDKHISARNVLLDEENTLYIAPFFAVNIWIDTSTNMEDLEVLLNHEALMGDRDGIDGSDFFRYAKECSMSYNDICVALKNLYGIKIKSKIENPASYLDNMEELHVDFEEAEFIQQAVNDVYANNYQFLPASYWLEKRLRFIGASYYDYLKVLSKRYLGGFLDLCRLEEPYQQVNERNLDYSTYKRIFKDVSSGKQD